MLRMKEIKKEGRKKKERGKERKKERRKENKLETFVFVFLHFSISQQEYSDILYNGIAKAFALSVLFHFAVAMTKLLPCDKYRQPVSNLAHPFIESTTIISNAVGSFCQVLFIQSIYVFSVTSVTHRIAFTVWHVLMVERAHHNVIK